jgi:superfamily I DNA/RNA helicase
LHDVWHAYGENTNWHRLKNVRDTFNEYKRKKHLHDFTDLIENFIKYDFSLPVKVAIIDEAQDLSTLQWKMVNTAFKYTERIYIAGDDDQAIYKWSGADVSHFLNLKGKITFLKKSHRLPRSVFSLSQIIVRKIKTRHDKSFEPLVKQGSVDFHPHLSSIKFNDEDWLLLARNRYLLKQYEEEDRYQGLLYSTRQGSIVKKIHCDAIYAWERLRLGRHVSEENANQIRELMGLKEKHWGRLVSMKDFEEYNSKKDPWYEVLDFIPLRTREYYRTILRNGGNLRKKPSIHIDSIHGVKGGEADNVVLITDMAHKTYQNYLRKEDDEHRVFYVGATRAKENLHIIFPQTEKEYLI